MKKIYYIETSKCRVYFESSDVKNMKIHRNFYEEPSFDEFSFQNCRFITDIHVLSEIYNNTNWSDIYVDSLENGNFLIIYDNSGGPQYAEYKIFDHDDILEDKC
jgi:hypothetical protein